MAIYKNVASQKIAVFAWDTANDTEKTGDAANITAQISKDGAACAATNDTNPTELDSTDAPGVYIFDMTQAETNCDLLILFAKSSTSDIKLEPVLAYTLPGDNAAIDASATELTTAAITDVWSTDTLTEAYASDGSAATPAQLLYMIWSALSEFAIASTTLTCKKLDGSTTSMTFTLDSATEPTSRTRAS